MAWIGESDFAARAVQFAEEVVDGKRTFCRQIRQACARFLADVDGDEWTLSGVRVQRKKRKGPQTVAGILGTGAAFWGRFLEFGTRKMSAKPWFGPAFRAAGPEALEIIKAELRAALRKAGGR